MLERFAGARVFVVDDNALNVALLLAVLGRAGIEHIYTESDSRQVLPRLGEVDPDLLILDLHMPHLDGFAVLEQIRKTSSSAYLPVLVLTADTTAAATQRALSAGAQDFVTKPFNNAELLLRAGNLLESRFLYTTLRGSILRAADERAEEEGRLTDALATEQESTERLRQLDALKETLMQTVSHDLRNPISAVLTLTTILAADANGTRPLTAEVRSAIIAKVALSARKMDRLLADLLDSDPMSQIAEHQTSHDIGELVRRVIADIDLTRDHPLHVDLVSVQMQIDPVHVERIVENLLSNANKHVEPGIPIWVKTARADGGVVISVADAGPGVAPALVESIFEPFERGPQAHVEGLGLGLSLVSRFAALHGGRAWVEPREGGGASFQVFLPIADDAAAG